MTKLTLVVNNCDSVKHIIIKTLKSHDGKFVSDVCALRNVKDFSAGIDALRDLEREGLVVSETNAKHGFTSYRFRSELALLRETA